LRSLASELRKDRLATVVIRAGGASVILVVLAMVLGIAAQAVPLFRPASTGELVDLGPVDALAVGASLQPDMAWSLGRDGRLSAAGDGRSIPVANLAVGGLRAADAELNDVVAALAGSGEAVVGRVHSRQPGDGSDDPAIAWRELARLEPAAAGDPASGITAAGDEERLVVARWSRSGVELVELVDGRLVGEPRWIAEAGVARVALAPASASVAIVTATGGLRLRSLTALDPIRVTGLDTAVTAARFLAGGRSLVIAGRGREVLVLVESPRVEVVNKGPSPIDVGEQWVGPGARLTVPADSSVAGLGEREDVEVLRVAPEWRVVHRLEPTGAEAVAIAASWRGRSFAVADAGGEVSVYNATSGRLLVRDPWAPTGLTAIGLAPRGNGLAVATGGRLLTRSLVSPHPEISLKTLFFPVWYEGSAEPRAVWQTSGGSDEFQPKFGLAPLLVGTVKATVYAMLVSVPLALLAALYVSQLAPGWLQAVVKPTVEMMAAVPTVVVGFIAALWLAPRLQMWLLPALVGVAALPVGVALALWLWRRLPTSARRRFPAGAELIVLTASCAAMVGLAVLVSGPIESWLFDGDFQRALFADWGVRYEQRNGIIVGLALGFAVIPVVFTLAEDACSGVPASLVQAARALGATRWQAALRLVVPAASPGLVAAVMLGLGRAVGETMIVLMAAGNTPILGVGPFSGMRTMAAAIAFETPEAAVGGTLFRVLFLTGLLLFALALIFTTGADLIGRRLRQRYARL
jgi:ABC-type uncharacterized transport system permease subunit